MTDSATSGLRPRPLSPHLSRYKPQISSFMSISHRASGVFLAFGALLITAFLATAAYSPDHFNMLVGYAHMPVGIIVAVLWSLAFFYHLGNGIRHLFWDAGYGFTIPVMTRSGLIVMLWAVAATMVLWLPLIQSLGGK